MKTSSLKKIPAAKAKRATVRFGRPPKELAGEVDARILDAARKTFLERGFEGASIDEIAEVARSGKATIYARFRDKRALFTEVVRRDILSRITEFKAEVPTGSTIEERLTSAASTLLHWGLDSERIALMRLAVAEARRFPDLASTVAGRVDAIRRASVAASLCSGAPDNHSSFLPRSHRRAHTAPGAVRGGPQDAGRRDRRARGAQRCVFSCRLPARQRELSPIQRERLLGPLKACLT